MCLDDTALRRELAVSHEPAVRQRGFEVLRWSRDVAGLCLQSGDETWGAVDIKKGERVVARIFPREAGRLKINNCANFLEDHYGKDVALNDHSEWSFDLSSSRFDLALAQRCIAEQSSVLE
jgi:hypothetical protein